MSWSLAIVRCPNPRCEIRNNVRYYNPQRRKPKCGRCGDYLDEQDRDRFERLFRIVHDELDLFEKKIDKKGKLVFIEWHIHKKEDLMNSEHLSRIYSITGKIGDDVQNWYNNNNLSILGLEIYEQHKEKIRIRLKDLNMRLIDRQPTFVDVIRAPLEDFIRMILSNLSLILGSKFDNLLPPGASTKYLPK